MLEVIVPVTYWTLMCLLLVFKFLLWEWGKVVYNRYLKRLNSSEASRDQWNSSKNCQNDYNREDQHESNKRNKFAQMYGWTRIAGDENSVSNGSRLPGFGSGWKRPKGPGPGQEPPSNPTWVTNAGLLPGPDINPRMFGRLGPGPQLHITVPAP